MEDLVLGPDGLARPSWAASSELMRGYYDTEWGMPITDEAGLFERLSLEAFQSGLSWAIILKKREHFRRAFAGFEPDAVAAFTEDDIARLMQDADTVRNRRKIEATVNNARATVELRAEGGLSHLIWSHKPLCTPRPETMAHIPTRSAESLALSRNSSGAVSTSWGQQRCSLSWKPSAWSTPTSWALTVADPPESGRSDR